MRSLVRKSLWLLVAALMIVIAPAWANFSPAAAQMDPHLTAQLATGADRLVVFVHAADAADADQAVKEAGLSKLQAFERVGVVAAVGSPAQINRAARIPSVSYLEADRPVRLHLETSHQATRGDAAYNGFTEGSSTSAPLDGSGVSIAIIDEGIDGTHPMFQQGGQSKVVKNLKLACHSILVACTGPQGNANDDMFIDVTDSTNDSDTISAGGHGTHVAGIAAGVPVNTSNGHSLRGAAPGAKLVGISIGAGLSIYGGAAGMNWVLEHHAAPCGTASASCPPIKVINNSWGATGEYNDNSTVAKIQRELVTEEGVTVVWAAGNGDTTNNGGDGSDNRVGNDAQAPYPGVITVANYDDGGSGNRNGELDSSSSRGHSTRPATWPDVSAPGSDITSACRPYLAICSGALSEDTNYGTISGTSMASPHVAGYVALLLQANPALTPGDIEDLLEDTAFKFTAGAAYAADPANTDNTSSFDKGHGLVDIKAAVAELRGITLTPETPVTETPFACEPGGAMVVDPEGDTWILRVTTNYTPPRDPGVDVIEGRMSWNSTTQALTATYKLDDLGETNGQSVPVAGYNVNFFLDGTRYFVEALRDSSGQETFRWGQWTANNQARVVLGPVSGDFDPAADTVSLTLTNADLAAADASGSFDAGDELSGVQFITRRAVDANVTSAGASPDGADSPCLFKIGTGPIAPPAPPAPGQDGTLAAGDSFSWTAGPFSQVNAADENDSACTGPTDTKCDPTRLAVTVPAGGADLKVTITAEIEADDYDVFLYGPDGAELDKSQNQFTIGEVVEFRAITSGTYTVMVNPYLAVGSYSGTATLTDAPPPPPPPSGDFDGEISSGGSYSWTGTVIPQPVFYCVSPWSELCDNELVKINVPTGGATVTIVVTPDDPDAFLGTSVQLYDPSGTRVAEANFINGTITLTKALTVSGVYRISVSGSSSVYDYSGSASLS